MKMLGMTTMKTIAMRALLLLAALWLAIPPPVPSLAAGPDLYMTIGPVIESSSPDGPIWTVEVTIGNAGTMKPATAASAYFAVSGPHGPVCQAGIPTISPQSIGPGISFKAFSFQLSTQNPKLKRGVRPGLSEKEKGQFMNAPYGFTGEVTSVGRDCAGQLQDTNCNNNSINSSLRFPPVGTGLCRTLWQQPGG